MYTTSLLDFISLGIAVYLLFGLLSFALHLGYLQYKFPNGKLSDHVLLSFLVGCCGPIGVASFAFALLHQERQKGNV